MSGEGLEQITWVRGGAMDFAIRTCQADTRSSRCSTSPPDRRHLRPRPSDVGSVHLALFVEDIDIQAALDAAAAAGWHARGTPQTMIAGPANAASSVQMRDPDGTIVELIQPPKAWPPSPRADW
jgi:hypothetical protein